MNLKDSNHIRWLLLGFIAALAITGCLVEDNVRPDSSDDDNLPLLVSPRSLDFSAHTSEQTLNISNAGFDTLDWHVTWDRNWLEASPSSGRICAETDRITVRVHREDLADGIYTGAVFIRDSEENAVAVSIRMSVQSPRLAIEPLQLDFGQNSTEEVFTIANIGGGDLHWRLETEEDWITCLPSAGTTSRESDPITVRINRTGLDRGNYRSEIAVITNSGDALALVTMSVGRLIWGFYPTDNTTLDRVWDCYDDNLFSDSDYWGVVTLMDDENQNYQAIWCNGRGIHPVDRYSDNMDAWMVQQSQYAADIHGYHDVEIRFQMAYETESPQDYVRMCIFGSDQSWYYLQDLTEWSGDDYVWRQHSVMLDDFTHPPADYLLLAFKFNSDISIGYRGAFVGNIEVWGD